MLSWNKPLKQAHQNGLSHYDLFVLCAIVWSIVKIPLTVASVPCHSVRSPVNHNCAWEGSFFPRNLPIKRPFIQFHLHWSFQLWSHGGRHGCSMRCSRAPSASIGRASTRGCWKSHIRSSFCCSTARISSFFFYLASLFFWSYLFIFLTLDNSFSQPCLPTSFF